MLSFSHATLVTFSFLTAAKSLLLKAPASLSSLLCAKPPKQTRILDKQSEFCQKILLCAAHAKAIYGDAFQLHDTISEIFLVTDNLLDGPEKEHKYKCAVTVNHSTKEITCVIAGTRIHGRWVELISDIKDDICIGLGKHPYKLESIKVLNDLIIDNMSEEYKICYTGHSLGGPLADLAATDMAIKLEARGILSEDKVTSITFENPGSHNIIQHFLAQIPEMRHRGATWFNDIKTKVDYTAINTRPNLVNSFGIQAGELCRLMHSKVHDYSMSWNLITQFKEHDMGYIIELLADEFVDVVHISGQMLFE